jgi:hypothetical protein
MMREEGSLGRFGGGVVSVLSTDAFQWAARAGA